MFRNACLIFSFSKISDPASAKRIAKRSGCDRTFISSAHLSKVFISSVTLIPHCEISNFFIANIEKIRNKKLPSPGRKKNAHYWAFGLV